MSSAQQSVSLEIGAVLSARMVRDDYGVPNSPTWMEAEDVEVEQIEINGKSYTRKELTEVFGEQGAKALMEIVCEHVDDDNWEPDEVDDGDYSDFDDSREYN
jgi:hypothetical protein